MSDWLILGVLGAGVLLYARFLVGYLWMFNGEDSVDGWALLTSAAAWILLLGGLFVDHWWNVPTWAWLGVVSPMVLASGILKNVIYERAKRDWVAKERQRRARP